MKFGVVLGSIRKNSSSEGIAKGIVAGLPAGSEVTWLRIDNLPLYNQDYDTENEPAEYAPFREEVKKQDAIIIVSPEHNRSIPAALKNAIDVASRPVGQNMWAGKPALVATQSTSGTAGVLGNHTIRQSLVFVDMPTMQQTELYINATQALNEDGTVAAGSVDFLANAGKSFAEFAGKFVS
ncbi:MAG: NADPH-dependent FMN reductase [Aerococcus sp.]|nr:NADPH-dependent FMN reductase [Aerococcus sp.]